MPAPKRNWSAGPGHCQHAGPFRRFILPKHRLNAKFDLGMADNNDVGTQQLEPNLVFMDVSVFLCSKQISLLGSPGLPDVVVRNSARKVSHVESTTRA